MKPTILQVWRFRSDSSDRIYETLRLSNNETSCNCPGWTRRVSADGRRSCKHTRLVDMQRADGECESSHDYLAGSVFLSPSEGERIKVRGCRDAGLQPANVLATANPGQRKFSL